MAPIGEVGSQFAQEAALDLLHVMASFSLPLRKRLLRAPATLPRLLRLLEPRVPPTLQRKAALLMLALAMQTPGAPQCFRPHERRIALLAMQLPADGGSSAAAQLAELLGRLAALQ